MNEKEDFIEQTIDLFLKSYPELDNEKFRNDLYSYTNIIIALRLHKYEPGYHSTIDMLKCFTHKRG